MKIRKAKISQMKIQQTAFLLLAVTLFFVLAGIFALGFWVSNLKSSATALEEKNAMLLVSKLANSPEFSCGNAYGINRINCVDADKFMVLKDESVKYRGFWGVENIEVRKLYPVINGNIECSISNYPECNIISLKSSAERANFISVENFVALCRKEFKDNKIYDKCEMAVLMVSYEKKQ